MSSHPVDLSRGPIKRGYPTSDASHIMIEHPGRLLRTYVRKYVQLSTYVRTYVRTYYVRSEVLGALRAPTCVRTDILPQNIKSSQYCPSTSRDGNKSAQDARRHFWKPSRPPGRSKITLYKSVRGAPSPPRVEARSQHAPHAMCSHLSPLFAVPNPLPPRSDHGGVPFEANCQAVFNHRHITFGICSLLLCF